MARVPGDLHSASLGQKTMTHTIQCPECGVVLNVPDVGGGSQVEVPEVRDQILRADPRPGRFGDRRVGPGLDDVPDAQGAAEQRRHRPAPPGGEQRVDRVADLSAPKKGVRLDDFDLPTVLRAAPATPSTCPCWPTISPAPGHGQAPAAAPPTPWRCSRTSPRRTASSRGPRPAPRPAAARAAAAWSGSGCRSATPAGSTSTPASGSPRSTSSKTRCRSRTRSDMPAMGVLFVGMLRHPDQPAAGGRLAGGLRSRRDRACSA